MTINPDGELVDLADPLNRIETLQEIRHTLSHRLTADTDDTEPFNHLWSTVYMLAVILTHHEIATLPVQLDGLDLPEIWQVPRKPPA